MGFLKGIPTCISPDLLHALAKMGHGDEIVLADAHFPAHSIGRANGALVLRADGLGVPELLHGILSLINLDQHVSQSVFVMQVVEQDRGSPVPIWDTYKRILAKHGKIDTLMRPMMNEVERYEFYEQSKRASVIVQTGETAKYGNIILKNGLVCPEPESGRFWETD